MRLPAPSIRPIDDDRWEVSTRWEISSRHGWAILIDPGFYFDGASIPRFFWRVVGHPFQGLALPGAVIHDALYATHLTYKKTADLLFRNMLLDNAVEAWKAGTMYRAVHWFGGKPYSNRTPEQLDGARRYVRILNPDTLREFPCID